MYSWNHGQACCAGSRIFVHAKIYDEFLRRFTEKSREIKLGDPFDPEVYQGPQVSQQQYDVSYFFFLLLLWWVIGRKTRVLKPSFHFKSAS